MNLMLRLSLFETLPFYRVRLKRNQVLFEKHSRRFSYTPRASFLISGTSFHRLTPSPFLRTSEVTLLHSALVQVHDRTIEDIKNPDGTSGTSGRWDCVQGTTGVLFRRCLGSSMWPLSRFIERSRLVNTPLTQRNKHYTASPPGATTNPGLDAV